MTLTNKIKNLIGQTVIYETDGLKVLCKITDLKKGYGKTFYKIEPLQGEGYKWTSKQLEIR